MIPLAYIAAGVAGTAAGGMAAASALAHWQQRRLACMWRVIRLHVPVGARYSETGLVALLTGLAGKLRRSPLSALLYGQPRVALEVRADAAGTGYHWIVPADEAKYVGQLLRTCLPGIGFEEVPDYLAQAPAPEAALAATEIRLQRPSAYPIADFTPQFAQTLLGVLDGNRGQGEITVQVLLRPARDSEWKDAAHRELLKAEGKDPGRGGDVFDTVNSTITAVFDSVSGAKPTQAAKPPTPSRLDRLATRDTPAKLLRPGFDVQIRVMATAATRPEAASLAARVAALFAALDGANRCIAKPYGLFPKPQSVWSRWSQRLGPTGCSGQILTPEELSSLINPAPQPAPEDAARVIELRQPPLSDGIHVCDGQYRGKRVQVRILPTDLDKHLGIQGKTGSGKGVIQENLFREVARLGMGGVYLDPLGGSVRKLLGSIPEDRMDDVIYIEAGHPQWVHPLNLLAGVDSDPESMAVDAVNLYYRLWSGAWGHNTEELLRAATIAALEVGGALPEVELILSDSQYRQSILHQVQNPAIRHFLAGLPDKVTESLRAPLNKLHELLWRDSVLAMVGQTENLDWRRIILEHRLVLVNLNKALPKIGQSGCELISGIIWSRIGRAGMSIPVPQRTRFVQIADEIKDVASRTPEDFETAFSQYRQFLLPVVAAGQYPRQLPEKVFNAMTGNIGSKVTLREDQPHSADCVQFVGGDGVISQQDLNNLPELTGFANLVADRRPTGVFTCWAPPFSKQIRDPDEAAEYSFRRWAVPRAEALAKINKRILAATGGRGIPDLT